MHGKGALNGIASEELMHQNKEVRALNEEQVDRQLIASVL